MAGLTLPSACGGGHIAMRLTPATLAGSTFISTEEESGAVPPGTYTPTLAIGRTSCPSAESD